MLKKKIRIVCQVCGFRDFPEKFDVVNEQWTCSRCLTDESGLIVEKVKNLDEGVDDGYDVR